VFPVVVRDVVSSGNSLVVASAQPVSSARLATAGPLLPADLQPLAEGVAGRVAPPLRGGAVYTDDKAPVEWLTDLSILRYAIGKR
jgi:hypothetical protein